MTKNQADLRSVRSYTNHLNSKDGKCYMVIMSTSIEVGSKTLHLYDVYDNKKLAFSWAQKDINTGQYGEPLCLITGGGDCNIIKVFEEKMESSVY